MNCRRLTVLVSLIFGPVAICAGTIEAYAEGSTVQSRSVAGISTSASTPGVDAVTLDLSSENNYFGFWWSAGDVNNSITLLLNGTALATFTTANLAALLPDTAGTSVTAVDGAQYNTINYYGNPADGEDTNEPFAHLNIIATGRQVNQVLFSNPGNTEFESDNHSVAPRLIRPELG